MNTKLDAAVVILFNPDIHVWDNICSYVDHVNVLYVIDNSIVQSALSQKLMTLPQVRLLHSGANIGIAKALNLTLDTAVRDHVKWLMTMDQDTVFVANDMARFIEMFYTLSHPKLALVSALHNRNGIQKNQNGPFVEKEYVMTSANIVNVKIAKKIGGYKEAFFIDEIDHDFCFRLSNNGYMILQNMSLAVHHSLGYLHEQKKHIKLYPASRLYYMARNYFYLKKEHQMAHHDFFQQRDRYLRQFFINQLKYGKNRFKNVLMILKGVLHFYLKRDGKILDD